MYEFWYDFVKPKYSENAKICYMDTDGFIVHVKTDEIYKNGQIMKEFVRLRANTFSYLKDNSDEDKKAKGT